MKKKNKKKTTLTSTGKSRRNTKDSISVLPEKQLKNETTVNVPAEKVEGMEQLTPNLTNPQTVCAFPEPNLEGLSISAKTYGYGPGVELAATANSHVNRVENRAEEASNSWGSSSLQCPLMGGNTDQPHCVTIHDASTGSANELHGDININIAAPSFSPVHLDEAKGPVNDAQTAENRGLLNRDHCIIIQGLPESSASTPRERVAADLEQLQKLLNEMLQPTEDVTVLKAYRLGSRTTAAPQTRPRPLKLVLGGSEQAKLILSRLFRLKHSHKGVFFQPDYSPAERMKRRELVLELRTRQTNGDEGLAIYKDQIVKRHSAPLWIKPIRMTAQLPG
ncbi:hypothetical protein SprV_0200604400 [Sparganum proliferum]